MAVPSLRKPKPTREQSHAVDLAATGSSLKIEAVAGAGKTSTLVLIAENALRGRGLYLAFNRTVAEEARERFPYGVRASTAHALAFGSHGAQYDKTRLETRLNGRGVADALNLPSIFTLGRDRTVTGIQMGYYILDTIARYCHSDDERIAAHHIPQIDAPNEWCAGQINDWVLSYTLKLWDRMTDLGGKTPITHDVYLKQWSLTRPSLPYSTILFDEAQDANGVMLGLVRRQKQTQIIFVGDRHQQLYSWRGACNAMERIKTTKKCTLSQSFRFGPEIAHAANAVLKNFLNADVSVQGYPVIQSKLAESYAPNAILCRTNGALISRLVGMNEKSQDAFVQGGTSQAVMLLKDMERLQKNEKAINQSLALFNSFDELEEYADTPAGGDMKVLVSQVKKHGIYKLVGVLSNTKNEAKNADVILSTVHKAKGLEWNEVIMDNDFRSPLHPLYYPEEGNLLYVAATRARKVLDCTECDAMIDALSWTPEKQKKAQEMEAARQGDTHSPLPEQQKTVKRQGANAPQDWAHAKNDELFASLEM